MNRATSAYIDAMEATSPVPEAEDNLIRSHFKSCYFPQVHCWLLCQKHNGKKKKLFNFLNNVPNSSLKSDSTATATSSLTGPRTTTTTVGTRSRSNSAFSQRAQSDLILHSSNCTIDFSPSLSTQRPSTRRINRNRFSSPGCNEVFNESPPEPTSINKPIVSRGATNLESSSTNRSSCGSLAQFFAQKLLNSSSAQSHMKISDQYFDLLQELSSWVEKKCNSFPVDDLRSHPTLNPNNERILNNEKDKMDHLLRQSGPPLPTGVTSRTIINRQPWKTPKTAYTTFFDEANSYPSEVASPFPPIEQSVPFCQFPHAEGNATPLPPPKVILRQALDDKVTNLQYKNIFQSKTCL